MVSVILHRLVLTASFALPALDPAAATSIRTFVASTGADSGGCTRVAPCRSFAYAITQTSPGGELDVLDTAGYGPVTITKSISIVNEGNIASIAVPAGADGIDISAGSTDRVHLRGLTIEGAGIGGTGVRFSSGAALEIQRSVIRNFVTGGFYSTSIGSTTIIANSLISDNGSYGVAIQPTGSGPTTNVHLTKVELYNNRDYAIGTFGNFAASTSFVVTQIVNCTAVGKGIANTAAFRVFMQSGTAGVAIDVVGSTVMYYPSSLNVDGPSAFATLAGNNFINPFAPITANGGFVTSYGDNYMRGYQANATTPRT